MEAPYGRCRQAPTAAAPAGLDSGGRSTEAAPAKCCWRRHEDEVAALAACQQLPSLKLALARSQELEPQSSSEIPFLTNAEALIVSGIYAAYALVRSWVFSEAWTEIWVFFLSTNKLECRANHCNTCSTRQRRVSRNSTYGMEELEIRSRFWVLRWYEKFAIQCDMWIPRWQVDKFWCTARNILSSMREWRACLLHKLYFFLIQMMRSLRIPEKERDEAGWSCSPLGALGYVSHSLQWSFLRSRGIMSTTWRAAATMNMRITDYSIGHLCSIWDQVRALEVIPYPRRLQNGGTNWAPSSWFCPRRPFVK